MEFFYENQGVNTYLVYKIKNEDFIDSLSLGMITNNDIPGLIRTIFTQMDDARFIKYNVSAKISMKQFFTGAVNRKRLLGVFSGIVNALLSAEDYMIDASCIILNTDYIFVDVSTCASMLVCLPISNNSLGNPDLGAFFKNIMVNTQFDQTENSDHVAKIFNYLNGSPLFSLIDFKKLIDNLKNESNQNSVQQIVSKPQPVQTVSQPTPVNTVRQVQQKSEPIVKQVQVTQTTPQTVTKTVTSTGNNVVKQPIQSQSQVQSVEDTEPEKKMSMFNLLMHYSKENKALYDQQKAAKKAKNAAQKQGQDTQSVQSKVNYDRNYSYNIPSADRNTANNSFAIPGDKSSDTMPYNTQKNQSSVKQQSQYQQLQNKSYNQSVQQAVPNKPDNQPVQQTLQNKPYSQPVQQSLQNKPYSQPDQQSLQNNSYSQSVQSQGQPMNFGNTTVLNREKIGDTTILNGNMQREKVINPHLVRSKNNEIINLTKPVFRIGKEKSYVDYFVSDNTAVSRSHANIITRENKYYIVDTNSTNHTFVNEKMIPSNAETEIHHGDRLRLGNENFEFKLY